MNGRLERQGWPESRGLKFEAFLNENGFDGLKGIQRNNFKKYRKQLNDTVMKRGKKEKDYKWQNHENEKITVLI